MTTRQLSLRTAFYNLWMFLEVEDKQTVLQYHLLLYLQLPAQGESPSRASSKDEDGQDDWTHGILLHYLSGKTLCTV